MTRGTLRHAAHSTHPPGSLMGFFTTSAAERFGPDLLDRLPLGISIYRLEEPATPIAPMVGDGEDFILLTDGTFLAGSGSKLYRLDPAAATPRWTEVVDLSFYGLGRITRLAFNGLDQLALVAE